MIKLVNPHLVALWNHEIRAQLGDGAFEQEEIDYRWFNLRAVVSDVDQLTDKLYCNFNIEYLNYVYSELQCVANRAIAYYNAGDLINREFVYDARVPVEKIFNHVDRLIVDQKLSYDQAIEQVANHSSDCDVNRFFDDVADDPINIVKQIYNQSNSNWRYNRQILAKALHQINRVINY